jgi:hypothetical protein
MADTPPTPTDALLPCLFVPLTNVLADFQKGVKFALAYHGRVLEVLDISHHRPGCIRVGIKGLPVILREDGSFNDTAPIWLFRAALPPTIGADAEALIKTLELAAWEEGRLKAHGDPANAAIADKREAREALRRHIAGLREERTRLIDELSYADLRVTNIEDRAEAAERELAGMRDALTTLEREACVAANITLDDDKIGRGIQHLSLLHPAIDKARAALAKPEPATQEMK